MRAPLIIAGPSAVGKSTVAEVLLSNTELFSFIRSVTTRARREGEDEYIYISEEEFNSYEAEGKLLECMHYVGASYGTPRSELERADGEGRHPLLILDLTGVESMRKTEEGKSAFCVYLYDDLNQMEERLYARELSSPSVGGLLRFAKRKEANINDYLTMPVHAHLISAFIKNETPESTAKAVLEAFDAFLKDGTELSLEKRAEFGERLKANAEEKVRAAEELQNQ